MTDRSPKLDELVSPAVEAVLQRWHPTGVDRLVAIRHTSGPDGRVEVVGDVDGVLHDELAKADPGLRFVDSPEAASVLVVRFDAAAPIGRTELELVTRSSAAGQPVVFALTGIDAHADWRIVRDRNIRLLGAYTARFGDARIWPVGGGSALTDLVREICDVLGADPASARALQLRHASAAVVIEARRRIATKAADLRASTEAAALRNERTALVARRDGGRVESMAILRSQIQLARHELLHEVGNRVRSVNVGARTEIERADRGGVAEFPGRLDGIVTAVVAQTDESVVGRVGAVQSAVLRRLEPTGDSVGYVLRLPPGPDLGAGPEPRRHGIEDRMMVLVGASAGFGIGRLAVAPLSIVPALDIASIPITLLLGGFAAWWLTRSRSLVADRAHLRQWTADVLVTLKSALEQRVVGAVVGAEADLADRVVRDSSARQILIDQEVARIDAEIRQLNARTTAQLASCERDLDVLSNLMEPRRVGVRRTV
ncbi:hypothetical protein ACHIPZ_11695 [Antrihabitans sp. NCIMB 15449]|uniref:Uncharacterized protein n=1 Tax=Antrihabitans spumae TaxID=3373370 RepID=A0ABW7JLI6_9NOCA